MDLFKRSQIPSVSILVDNERGQPFRPGSRVSGTITLHSSSQRQLVDGELLFFGRAVTHCTRIESLGTSVRWRANYSTNETIHYHDDACLFRFTQKLTGNALVEANHPYSWRFDFVFGDFAKLVGQSPYQGPTAPSSIYANGRHLLPPTFERYFNDNHYAFVEYRLQAIFQFIDFKDPLTMHFPLSFLPHGHWPDPSNLVEYARPMERYSSSRLLEGHSSFRHSFRSRVSSDTPSVDVVMKASLCPQAVRPSDFPVYTCVEILNPSSSSIAIPRIDLAVKLVTLYQTTFFRGRQVRGFSPMIEYQEVGEDGILLESMPNSVLVEAQEKVEGETKFLFFPAMFQIRIPSSTSPSFRTFNINHSYQMGVTVEANISGKKFEHKIIVESFTLLPSG